MLAKKAVEQGPDRCKPYVKTSLAPGSRVVTDYLDKAGLTEPLDKLGFHTVGYGCTTCIGNSGPLPDPVAKAVTEGDLVAAAVLSGNRNFEGRVNPLVKANYLASPPLVVAYALAGTTDIDLINEPLGTGSDGKPVYLKDIWPTQRRSAQTRSTQSVLPEMFQRALRATSSTRNETWNEIQRSEGDLYRVGRDEHVHPGAAVLGRPAARAGADPADSPARGCWRLLGDSVTTDHISPAGSIAARQPGRAST